MQFRPKCGYRLDASAPAPKPAQASAPANPTVPAEGSAEELNKRGVRYYNGDGVTQDYSEAVRLFRMAAEQGNEDAQNNLGGCYLSGLGVAQDYSDVRQGGAICPLRRFRPFV